jgi:thiosulfate dehydrogenase [quinone] large subunit
MMEDYKLGRLQMNALVVLRVFIGWHFLYEGISKITKAGWSAEGYLLQSKGIFAGLFQWMAEAPGVIEVVNVLNIWGLIAVGLGLILGALTMVASFAGILLLLLYYLANPPMVGYFYSIPMEGNYLIVNKNLVEMAALFLVGVTRSGYYLGLDRLIQKYLAAIKGRNAEVASQT